MVDDHTVPWPFVHGQELAPAGDGVLVVDEVPAVGYHLLVVMGEAVIACTRHQPIISGSELYLVSRCLTSSHTAATVSQTRAMLLERPGLHVQLAEPSSTSQAATHRFQAQAPSNCNAVARMQGLMSHPMKPQIPPSTSFLPWVSSDSAHLCVEPQKCSS